MGDSCSRCAGCAAQRGRACGLRDFAAQLALALHRGPDSSRAEVELGDTKCVRRVAGLYWPLTACPSTRAAAIVRAALVQPNADRPSEGMLRIRVDMSGIASQGFEVGAGFMGHRGFLRAPPTRRSTRAAARTRASRS